MEDSRSAKRCVAFPYCGECKCGQTEKDVSIAQKIGEFFDVMINDNYRKGMLKYINMAALRDDFITETIKVIDEAKNISNFDKRWQCVLAYTYKIPFEFSRVTDGDISGEISDFILNMVNPVVIEKCDCGEPIVNGGVCRYQGGYIWKIFCSDNCADAPRCDCGNAIVNDTYYHEGKCYCSHDCANNFTS